MGTLSVDALPLVDLNTLTQSELQSLSLCLPSAFDLRRTDDLVIPSIDPSQFNESAGSRRQTFSRPSPDSHHHHHHHHHHHLRHRLPGLLPSSKPLSRLDDPEASENRAIISSLKMSLKSLPDFQSLDFTSPPSSPRRTLIRETIFNFGERDSMTLGKRKRGSKPNAKVGSSGQEVEMGLQMVNKNGVAVNLVALAGMDDPYGVEIRRRTETMMGNEEALLGFMRDLGGQWCSRRRKRKIVDASIFGDVLPVGWKVLLGLKRREGRASVYCRRYVSPGGRHFVSCMEVSAYLRSYAESNGVHQAPDKVRNCIQQSHQMASESRASVSTKEDNQAQHNEREGGLALVESDNLADVQIHDLFDCHKCNLTFNEKDAYLQHLLKFHQRSTRRYRIGSSVADGVIIRDGKFECQFCHKVFQERRRYNGHVGIHVRNYVRGIEESPGLLNIQRSTENPIKQELPMRSSRMDALIEIAQNSILETADRDEPQELPCSDKLNVRSDPEIPSNSDHGSISDSPLTEPESENVVIKRTADHDLPYQESKFMITDERTKKVDSSSNIIGADISVDVTSSLSLNEQIKNVSGNMDEKIGLALTSDEHDQSDIEKGNGTVSLTIGLSTDCSISVVDTDVIGSHHNMLERPKQDDVEACKSIELVVDLSKDSVPAADIEIGKVDETFEGKVVQAEVSENPLTLLQAQNDVPASNATFDKGDDAFCSIDKSNDSVTGINELSLDEIDQFGFGTEEESPGVHMGLESGADLVDAYASSAQFEPEVELDMSGGSQLTTSCVWCGVEFNHDVIDSEVQSGSVGYMCQSCKTKISGQISALNGGAD